MTRAKEEENHFQDIEIQMPPHTPLQHDIVGN